MNRCQDYCGIKCVDGCCPNTMTDEHSKFRYKHHTCDECEYYKGCDDCCFAGMSNYCPKENNNDIVMEGE